MLRFLIMLPSLTAICLLCFLPFGVADAQSAAPRAVLNFYELKGLLLKHRPTVESILSMKRFRRVSEKERGESTIYTYVMESDGTKLLVRVRRSDSLVSEVAWHEAWETLGNLTHDAIHDGFVPVAGNSQYYNRFQKVALLINFPLEEKKIIPCQIRSVE